VAAVRSMPHTAQPEIDWSDSSPRVRHRAIRDSRVGLTGACRDDGRPD
jgi:hypothetical protein